MGLLRANREMQLLVSDNGGGLFRAAVFTSELRWQQLEGLPEPRAGPHLQGSCIRRLDAAAV